MKFIMKIKFKQNHLLPMCSIKSGSENFRKIHRKAPTLQALQSGGNKGSCLPLIPPPQKNLSMSLFPSISPLYGHIPYSSIFKLKDSKDSKDSNYVCNKKYIDHHRKKVNKNHFLSYITCISVSPSKISE